MSLLLKYSCLFYYNVGFAYTFDFIDDDDYNFLYFLIIDAFQK